VTVVSGVMFGLVPALKSTRVDLTPALKDGAMRAESSRRWITGQALLISQLALGVIVIATAVLLGRSVYNLKTLDAGFRADHVLVFALDSYGTRLTSSQRFQMYAELLERLRTLPGVLNVAASRSVPVHTSGNSRALEMPGPPETMSQRAAFANMVTPGYFDTFGIRLLRGRDFNDGDRNDALRVAVINQAMARLYFGERDPIGQTFAFFRQAAKPHTVIGVVEDTHQMNLREPAPPAVFTPLSQETETPSFMHFDVRTAQDPTALAAAATAAARAVSRDVVIRYVRTMEQQINASLIRERLMASLSTAFAALALAMVAVGLYGVMSYTVSRRGREIGIRMALGARRGEVLWNVLRQTLLVSSSGIVIGVAVVWLTARYLSTLLFGLSERDPITLIAVSAMLLLTAAVAGFFPARRAATMDPVRAIKAE
jgi:predicted permease